MKGKGSMSLLRQNPLTKEWVIMATDRAKRPDQLRRSQKRKPHHAHDVTCPFCPGNEHLTPPEQLRISATEGEGWKLRIVPNKFPALSIHALPTWKIRRTHRSIEGAGVHDVIIETPNHSLTTALLSQEQLITVLRTYKDWFNKLSEDPRVAHVTIFKNHGPGAGSSLAHPHSQFIASPVVSSLLRARFYEALRHWDEFGECLFCEVLRDEIQNEKRVVVWSNDFVAFEPFASISPFLTAPQFW
jgi:UDPglucose--hexose-1-phosphate uridylyltransferase